MVRSLVSSFFSRRRRLFFVFIAILMLIIGPTLIPRSSNSIVCNLDSQVKGEMEDIFYRTLHSLQSLNLESYFLCYDSLWAALMQNKPFNWSNFIELCILNEELTEKVEEATLIRAFKHHGLSISYSSSVGEYIITDFEGSSDASTQPRVKMYLFEKDSTSENYKRIGWRHRIMPPDQCTIVHCFPTNLLDQPLPLVKFLKTEVSVPREKIEIQKYHFPNNWWKPDRTPDQCTEAAKFDH